MVLITVTSGEGEGMLPPFILATCGQYLKLKWILATCGQYLILGNLEGGGGGSSLGVPVRVR